MRLFPGKLYYNPDWIVLGVNNLCNLHCKMCDVGTQYSNSNFYTNLMGSSPVNMPLELIRKVIDQTACYFSGTKLGYGFTEPLIYPYLAESLEYADKKGLYTSITTNALTLRKKADELVKSGLNDIFVSLDGPPGIHNSIRGHKMSFEYAMEGIDTLLGMDRPPGISIYCTITEWNIGHLAEFVDLFRNRSLRALGFMHTNFTPQHVADYHNTMYGDKYPATDSNVTGIDIDKMDLDLLWNEIELIKKSSCSFPVLFSPELRSDNELHKFYKSPEKFIGKRCYDIFRNIMVKSDGTVIPAHGRCYNLNVGNVYDNDLRTIWNSKNLVQFRQTVNKAGGLLPACARCCSAFK